MSKAVDIYKQTAQQITTGAQLLMERTKDWQTIKQFINNRVKGIQLNDIQQQKLKRYKYAYDQLSSGKYIESEVVNQLCKFFDIELSQAYEDLKCMKEIWTDLLHIDKHFELQMELLSARDLKRRCIEMGDFPTAQKYQKTIIEILAELPDQDTTPGEMFESHTIEVTFDPALLQGKAITKEDMKELLQRINEKRGKKINLDFLDFEEVK